jgi:hypothetical protein
VKTEAQDLMKQIDEAFATGRLGLGCRLQAEFRKRFGRNPLPEGMAEAEPAEGPAIYVGVAGVRSGGYRRSGASRRR